MGSAIKLSPIRSPSARKIPAFFFFFQTCELRKFQCLPDFGRVVLLFYFELEEKPRVAQIFPPLTFRPPVLFVSPDSGERERERPKLNKKCHRTTFHLERGQRNGRPPVLADRPAQAHLPRRAAGAQSPVSSLLL